MRTFLCVLALLAAPAAQAQTLDDLAWLKGCWRTEAPREAEAGAQITEVWLAPPMPAMLGYSYTIGEGQVQGWEQTRIEMIDGVPTFVAMPNGGAPVRFRLTEMTVRGRTSGVDYTGVVFENPNHDFPKRVMYRRERERGVDYLIATISGADGADAITFTYRRIRCEAALRP